MDVFIANDKSGTGGKKRPLKRSQLATVTHSKARLVELRYLSKRIPWTKEEDETLVKMKEDGCSWEEISDALPSRTPGAIQVRYFTKLGSGTRLRKCSRW